MLELGTDSIILIGMALSHDSTYAGHHKLFHKCWFQVGLSVYKAIGIKMATIHTNTKFTNYKQKTYIRPVLKGR